MNIHDSDTIDLDGTTADVLPSCSTGDVLSNRYRLDQEIGRGGMGVVFRAWDTELERQVAVKVLNARAGIGDARERLFREARATAALSHPHVVAVYDVGEHERTPYLVMELIRGPNLTQRRPDTLDEIITVALQICDALEHAHRHGLIHRDLKPGNVLYSSTTDEPAIKIVDLGLAIRDRGVRLTQGGGISGTVAYMAPEQALGNELDGRTDLYALGVMLYELTTGRLPFDADSALAVLSQHLHAPVVPPRTYRADLPEFLDAVILRLLAKSPEQRFATAAEVADAISQGPTTAPAAVATGTSAALGGLIRGRIVARDEEIDALRRCWFEAVHGRGGMVLVSGEPGSGKTRLARELVDYARITGGIALAGGCYELEAATPYLPFIEALRTWVHAASDDDIRAAVGTSGGELARLAPELAARIGPFPDSPELSAPEQRLRLFDGVARCLFRLAESDGLLLFIDDLQWADQASISLLHYLVRLVARERVLLLGCYRDTELDRARPLAEALDDWNRQRAAVRIHLSRLDASGTAAMLAVLLGDENLSTDFCTEIHRETEGNPFFIEEVVKTLVNDRQIECRDGRWCRHDEGSRLVLPQGVKAAIGRRLDHVSETATEVLRTAAILGKHFQFSQLAAVTDLAEEALLDALDEAVNAQLLETTDGETIIFTHDKIREVLSRELNPIRRRRLHGRIAEALDALRARGGRVAAADLARHFMEGGCLDRGFEYAIEAAETAASVYAYDDALQLYERARDCAEALDRTDDLPAIDTAIGDILNLKGEVLRAATAYERALAEIDDPDRITTLKSKIGEAYVMVGDRRALDAIDDVKATLDPEKQPAEVARAMMVEGRFHHYHGHSADAAELLLEAAALAERSGDIVLRSWIYAYLAGAYQHLIEFEESNRWAQRCIELGDKHDNPGTSSIGYEFLMENAFMRGDWRTCLEHTARHRALSEAAKSSDRLAWNHLGRAYGNFGLGRLEEAEAACDDGLEIADRLGDERLAAFLAAWKAEIAAERGRTDEAATLADRAVARADALGFTSGRLEARRSRACVALLQGDHDGVLDATGQIEELLEGTDESVQPMWMYPVRCRSLVATGRLDEAEARLQYVIDSTRSSSMPHFEAMALATRARLHDARGDRDAARRDCDRAIEIFSRLGSRIELERTQALRSDLAAGSSD